MSDGKNCLVSGVGITPFMGPTIMRLLIDLNVVYLNYMQGGELICVRFCLMVFLKFGI